MCTNENNSGNFHEFNCLEDMLLIKLQVLYNYLSNQMDKLNKLIVFLKSSYQKDLCLASLIIVYQVSYNKNHKSIKPFSRKVGQRHVIERI